MLLCSTLELCSPRVFYLVCNFRGLRLSCLYLWSGLVACSQLPVESLCLSLRSFFRPHSCIWNIATAPQTPWLHTKQAPNNQKSLVQLHWAYASNEFSLLPFQSVRVRRQTSASCEGKGFTLVSRTDSPSTSSGLVNTGWPSFRGAVAGTCAVGCVTWPWKATVHLLRELSDFSPPHGQAV